VKPVAAIVLAAGLSSRMRTNKLLLPIGGKPVIRHVAEAVVASRASPVIIVTGSAAPEITAALEGLDVKFHENSDYAKGLSESLKCGVRQVPPQCAGVLVVLGDMPFVSTATIDRLAKAFEAESGGAIGVPACQGRRGNPVLWGRRFFAEILALTGDKGAKSLMSLHDDSVFELEVDDEGILIDIDTPADLQHHQR
jgi:molybdenum cofactor cytidylyltransferase